MSDLLSELLRAVATEEGIVLDAGHFSLAELVDLAAAAAQSGTRLHLQGCLDRFSNGDLVPITEAGAGVVEVVS